MSCCALFDRNPGMTGEVLRALAAYFEFRRSNERPAPPDPAYWVALLREMAAHADEAHHDRPPRPQ